MAINLHPSAIKAFNSKADALARTISTVTVPDNKQPDLEIHTEIVNPVKVDENRKLTDIFGQDHAWYFKKDDENLGFIGNSFDVFVSLAQGLYKIQNINEKVSLSFIKNALFLWCRNKYSNAENTTFIDSFLVSCDEAIKDYQVFIPTPYTIIERPFTLGHIHFSTLTQERIFHWFQRALSTDNVEIKTIMAENMKKVQKDYQGFAIGTFSCNAEQVRAEEKAYDYFSDSLCILRMLSAANYHYKLTSNIYEFGHRMNRVKEFFIQESQTDLVTMRHERIGGPKLCRLDNHQIDYIDQGCLSKINQLLTNQKPNDYKKNLWDAIRIYSKNTLRHELFDKLLYILVALETMLLRNNTEPIQQNVGERLAFLIGRDLAERQSILKTIRGIYTSRSEFVHHGSEIKEDATLFFDFMRYAWRCFATLIMAIDNYNSKIELLDDLDERKLS